MLDKKTKEIRLYKNAVVFNKNHNASYVMKKYVEIEFFNGDIIKLSIEGKADITDSDYLEIKEKGKLVKTLFRNEIVTNFFYCFFLTITLHIRLAISPKS